MLLLAPVSIQLCDAVGRDPRPFLISLALFGNVGGTMTMIGDPPNIIIGNMMKEFVTFNDFIVYLGPGVIISLPTSFWFTKWYFRAVLGDKMEVNLEQLEKDNSIRDHRLLIKTGIMLVAVIAGFFLHPVIHMDPVYVAVSGAIVIFALDNHHDLEEALEGVEWDTLIFFAALFVMVEGLAEMGLLRMIGNQLSEVVESFDPASRQANAIIIVSYVSAVTSAFVDNIPFTTTMIPIIKQIAEDVDGIRIEPLIWSLAFGSCLGGMGTLIGASDNVVMAGIAEKAGYHVSFMSFMRIGFPFMIQSVTITTVWMLFLNATGIWDDFTEGEYSQIVEEGTPHG
jgi:Na+/H+ antiporter NhaD/arsenite permease-like protein